MNNILSLLRPKDYVSKIKLYCRDCETNVKIAEKVKQTTHTKRIKIAEENGTYNTPQV